MAADGAKVVVLTLAEVVVVVVVAAAAAVAVVLAGVTGGTNPVHALPVDINVAVRVSLDIVGTVYAKVRVFPVLHLENRNIVLPLHWYSTVLTWWMKPFMVPCL